MIGKIIVITIGATCANAQQIFNKYTDSEEVPEIANSIGASADKWNYDKQGNPTDWTMPTCDVKRAASYPQSPIDIDTTFTNPASCANAMCYYDWSIYHGSYIPRFMEALIDEKKSGPNPPENPLVHMIYFVNTTKPSDPVQIFNGIWASEAFKNS